MAETVSVVVVVAVIVTMKIIVESLLLVVTQLEENQRKLPWIYLKQKLRWFCGAICILMVWSLPYLANFDKNCGALKAIISEGNLLNMYNHICIGTETAKMISLYMS